MLLVSPNLPFPLGSSGAKRRSFTRAGQGLLSFSNLSLLLSTLTYDLVLPVQVDGEMES